MPVFQEVDGVEQRVLGRWSEERIDVADVMAKAQERTDPDQHRRRSSEYREQEQRMLERPKRPKRAGVEREPGDDQGQRAERMDQRERGAEEGEPEKPAERTRFERAL